MAYEGGAILARADLGRFIDHAPALYISANHSDHWYMYLTNDAHVRIWHFQKKLRISEYWFNNRHRSPLHYLMFLWKYRLKNNADVLGIGISENSCDIGLRIYHGGSNTIADDTKIGAGAAVVKSSERIGAMLVGVPAKPLERSQ